MTAARRAGVPAALALAGAGALLAGAGLRGDRGAPAVAPPVPINAGARDPANIQANNSPTLVRNPVRPGELAEVHRIDSPRYGCGMNVSRDGGGRWAPVTLPIPRGEQRKCFAPDAAYGADGTLYVTYVTLRGRGNVPHAAWLVRTRDGGRTLSAPRRLLGPLAFQVRIAADPRRAGRIYVTWLRAGAVGLYRFAGTGFPIEVMRSDDAGATWSRGVRVSAPERPRVVAPSPLVAPDGTLYVLYLDLGDDRLDYEGAHEGFGGPPYRGRFMLVLARSADAGRSWQESVVDRRVVPVARFLAFLPPFPSLALDRRSGRLYVAFQDARAGSADVQLWSLGRGEAAWSGPVRVNDTPLRDGTSQYLPRLGVAPSGRLDVVYYDRRADPRDVRTEISLQSSFDGGRTFGARRPLSGRGFDSRIGAGAVRGLPDLGSRLGLVSENDQVLAAWSDTRAAPPASNKQDIALGRASFGEASALGDSLRYAGFALWAGALAAALLALRRR